jgi:MFS family permease
MAFLGGFGTLAGPILGGLILEPLQQWVTITFTNGYIGQILLGALFLLVILFLPRGIIPTAHERLTAWRAWRERRGGGPSEIRPAGAAGAERGAAAGPVVTGPETGTRSTPSAGSAR